LLPFGCGTLLSHSLQFLKRCGKQDWFKPLVYKVCKLFEDVYSELKGNEEEICVKDYFGWQVFTGRRLQVVVR
jgi:hypothetical protein